VAAAAVEVAAAAVEVAAAAVEVAAAGAEVAVPRAEVVVAQAPVVPAVTPAAVEELAGLAQAQNLAAPLGAPSRRRPPQWMRLARSSTKTAITWV
jgi:hypothetical protein